jgi:glycosyltransferase involved in cell wall biosynthesis
MQRNSGKAGALDGATVLRFAHAFESGGGTERYLDDLDRTLLERNAMTIIRVTLASDRSKLSERTIPMGRGFLALAPVALPEGESLQLASDHEASGRDWKRVIRDSLLYNELVWRLFTGPVLMGRKIARSCGQAVGAGAKVADLLKRFPIDLIVLHFIGGADTEEIIEQARLAGVPFAVINHYSNDRFLHLSIRKHTMLAEAVGGVNGLGLPEYVRQRFQNLSDGVDLEFFRREKACPLANPSSSPVILLPARIVRPKGQLDLVQAAAKLRKTRVDFKLVFAGRTDSENFVAELRREINASGLSDRVEFVGDLSVEQLRDWYAASAVVAFPTYHHEGLGRVTVEAQAMKTPPVAYATGGVPEGLVHGETGYLVDTGDISGLAARLDQLLGRPELRRSMGESGRRFVEQRFSLEALALRHESLYLKLAHRTSGPFEPPGIDPN